MHISSDRLTKSLTPVEEAHLKVCKECQAEREAILTLLDATQYIELVKPPEQAWTALQSKMDMSKYSHVEQVNEKRKIGVWQWFGAAAATVVIGLLGNLSFQQYQIQQELAELRNSNRHLESQLSLTVSQDIPQEMLSQMLQIEQRLSEVDSTQEFVQKLKERKALMSAILEVEMRENKEDVISL